MSEISRRKFMITEIASTMGSVLLKGCLGNPPEPGNQGNSNTQSVAIPKANIPPEQMPEVKTVKIGFIGQTDAAPLIIAKEKGYFAKWGLDVTLQKQPSWAVIRDKLELGPAAGGLESAMVLTPMPYLMAMGLVTKGNAKIPMMMPLRLNVGGQGISVANTLKDTGVKLDTSVLKGKVSEAKLSGKQLRFAHTFKGGTSDMMLRYWLAAGGIDPDNDVITQIVPGAQLVTSMQTGDIQGFCVGDPWHLRAINQKVGYTALVTGEMWKDHPEKALSFRGDWALQHPKTTIAILKAVIEAQQWCDKMEHRQEMAQILSRDEYAKIPVPDIIDRLQGKINYGDSRPVVENSPNVMRYWEKGTASFPYKSHDLWFLLENERWGNIPKNTDLTKLISEVNGATLWRQAAQQMGVSAAEIPVGDSRGVEVFFDGVTFDPEKPQEYLKSLKIKRT